MNGKRVAEGNTHAWTKIAQFTTAAAAHGYGNGNDARGHFRRRGNGGHNGSSSGGPMPPAFDDTCYDVTTFNTVRFEMVSCLSIFS